MEASGTKARRGRFKRFALLSLASGLAMLGGASSASAVVFTNPSRIAINDEANATPYPSTIDVSGLGFTTDVNVTLFNYSHTFPDDVGAVLVAPGGQALDLMQAVGSDIDASNLQLTFDDSAAAQLPTSGALATGTYKPTANDHLIYPAPGPVLNYNNPGPEAGGTATLASTFNTLPANGQWKLFVRDFYDPDSGSIAGGWALDLTAPVPPVVQPKKKCKKGKKSGAAAKKKCKRKKKKK